MMESLDKIRDRVKIFLWPYGLEWINFAIWAIKYHAVCWCEKNEYIKSKDRIEMLLRFMSILSIIIGSVLIFGHSSMSSSYFERAVDSQLHYKFLDLYLHRWFGVAMLTSGILSLIAVMESPTPAEQDTPGNFAFNKNKIKVLTSMQLIGMTISGCYWFISFLVTVFPLNDPLRMSPLTSLAFAYAHYEMCMVINKLYVRTNFRIARANNKVINGKNYVDLTATHGA